MELFKIFGTIALKGKDQFNGDIDESSSKAEKLSGKIGKGLVTAAKIGAAAVGAAATAIGALTKTALDNYAEYEQLVGGAELMFGEAFSFIEEKSKNAYSTVQMSQNDYLRQVNGFATGLKTALGGNAQAAAELADRIINAEADVVAATGNSQEAVQNAFNGIMKSNFTMLDNLQLGITPTKEGFQEVIDKVNDWNAANGKATKYQIENLADCQSALVDYIEMQGLAGYAADEAAGTIQGSISMMKAAWTNLLTGIGDDTQDMDKLIDNFVESTGTAAENILPRLGKILTGIGSMIERLAPVVASAIPGLVTTVLPKLVQSGISMVGAILQGLVQMLPQIIQYGVDMVITLIESISSDPESLVETAITLVVTIVSGLIDALPKLIAAAAELVTGLLRALISNAPNLLAAGLKLVGKIAEGIANSLGEIVKAGAKVVDSIIDGIAGAWKKLTGWFKGIWNDLFGDLSANVSVNGSAKGAVAGVNGSHASGLDYVPFDGYIAELHKGEMVVPKREAQTLRNSEETEYLLRQILDCLKSSQTISINSREFGRLVRGVT